MVNGKMTQGKQQMSTPLPPHVSAAALLPTVLRFPFRFFPPMALRLRGFFPLVFLLPLLLLLLRLLFSVPWPIKK